MPNRFQILARRWLRKLPGIMVRTNWVMPIDTNLAVSQILQAHEIEHKLIALNEEQVIGSSDDFDDTSSIANDDTDEAATSKDSDNYVPMPSPVFLEPEGCEEEVLLPGHLLQDILYHALKSNSNFQSLKQLAVFSQVCKALHEQSNRADLHRRVFKRLECEPKIRGMQDKMSEHTVVVADEETRLWLDWQYDEEEVTITNADGQQVISYVGKNHETMIYLKRDGLLQHYCIKGAIKDAKTFWGDRYLGISTDEHKLHLFDLVKLTKTTHSIDKIDRFNPLDDRKSIVIGQKGKRPRIYKYLSPEDYKRHAKERKATQVDRDNEVYLERIAEIERHHDPEMVLVRKAHYGGRRRHKYNTLRLCSWPEDSAIQFYSDDGKIFAHNFKTGKSCGILTVGDVGVWDYQITENNLLVVLAADGLHLYEMNLDKGKIQFCQRWHYPLTVSNTTVNKLQISPRLTDVACQYWDGEAGAAKSVLVSMASMQDSKPDLIDSSQGDSGFFIDSKYALTGNKFRIKLGLPDARPVHEVQLPKSLAC